MRAPKPIATLLASSGLLFTTAAATTGTAPASPCGGDLRALETGQVLVVEREPTGGRGIAVRACAVVEAPPGEVWPVLRDCDKYQDFMPGVGRSVLQSRDGNVAVCDETIDLPLPLADLHSVSRAVESERTDGGFERHWTLLRGTYERLVAAWTLLPWGAAGSRTLLVYDLDMDPHTIIPDFLLRRVQSSTAPRVFAAIRERVRSCSAAAPAPSCATD